MTTRPYALLQLVAVTLLVLATSEPAWAQEMPGLPSSGLAQQSLRPYWHVFIAYAIAIVLVLGWVVSISRRLKDVEERLKE
ncbi:MAG: CcmD family protein [Gemmatimonadota bacterium]|nr:CcmD family protein [Gemmatimonadota bacterium]